MFVRLTAVCLSRASEGKGKAGLWLVAGGHHGGQGLLCPLVARTATHLALLALLAASGRSGTPQGFRWLDALRGGRMWLTHFLFFLYCCCKGFFKKVSFFLH